MGAPNAGGVGKIAFLTSREVFGSDLPPKVDVHLHGGPRPRRCAGGGIRDVINNFGDNRALMITVTVQLTSTKSVV